MELNQSEKSESSLSLARFRADFDKMDPGLKAKCPWAEISSRLLANEGRYLALAEAMNEGGILFGVDYSGNPLFADRGDEPIMKNMNYKDTRDRVLYEHDASNNMVTNKDGNPIPTGYEMFPYRGHREKSNEILQYEAHTKKPFVKAANGDWCSSWLESGENPSLPRDIYCVTYDESTCTYLGYSDPWDFRDFRGVRRLLRIKKNPNL